MFNPASYPERHMSMEGIYEYGARALGGASCASSKSAGCRSRYLASTALQRHPELTQAFVALGHEIACHGLKWIHYQHIPEDVEARPCKKPWPSSSA